MESQAFGFIFIKTHPLLFETLVKEECGKLISVKFMSIWIEPLPFGWAIPGLSGSAAHGSVRHPERLLSAHHWAHSSSEDLEGTESMLLQQLQHAAAAGHTWDIGVTVARCMVSSLPSSTSLAVESSHREKTKKKISMIQ